MQKVENRNKSEKLPKNLLQDIRENAQSWCQFNNVGKYLLYIMNQTKMIELGHTLPDDKELKDLAKRLNPKEHYLIQLATTRIDSFPERYNQDNLSVPEIVYAVLQLLINNENEYNLAVKDLKFFRERSTMSNTQSNV